MPYSALNSNYWRLNFENPSTGSRVMWPQHPDIQTDRQTYIHTDRQTEPNYDIDTVCPFFNRTCSKANSSKWFHWKFLIFDCFNSYLDNIFNFKYHKFEIRTFCFMMDFRNLVIFQKRLKITNCSMKIFLSRECM